MARIAVAGFQHETNTFAQSPATYDDFVTPSGWPGLTRGQALFADVAGINISIAGFIEEARSLGHQIEPLTWAAATPSAPVTEDAFERISVEILDGIKAQSGIEALYLDLHGAMVTEQYQDGEGELLKRIRALVGRDLPIAVSLDLHANVTPEMMVLADLLVAYRTYPHIDMAETGSRTAQQLDALLRSGHRYGKAFCQLPFLIPLSSGCTMLDPAKSLYASLSDLETGDLASLSFAAGFGPADIWHCGPSLFAYGSDEKTAQGVVDRLYRSITEQEADFVAEIWQPEAAVRRAIEQSQSASRPVILADSQDNPGGGADSDTVGLLAELVRQNAQDAALAILYDPAAAAAAHAAGEGAEISVGLGAKSGLPGHQPFAATFTIEKLGDGRFTGTGPFYRGARMQLGPMALLRLNGVRIVVASRKLQAADQAIFRHLGVEPAVQKILALKSSVHFRADFQPIAEAILVVAAPGPNPLDYSALNYQNLRPGLRLMPLGLVFGG